LTLRAAEFRQYTQTGITFLADESATVNVKLEMGSTTETMTRSGRGPRLSPD
jgi:hypothetical protein